MYCPKCGTQLPDDAAFCMKCGTGLANAQPKQPAVSASPVLAPLEAKSLKCPHCGAPITPKFGEMIITCEYCGTGVTLGNDGWRGIQKQTMLPLKSAEKDKILSEIHGLMDRGLLHRHLQEDSTLEEMNLSFVPYWIVSVSARTSVAASDMAVEMGEIATTAALAGVMGSAFGGRRRGGFAGPLVAGAMMGTALGPRNAATKTFQMDNNYNFPVVALKALTEHQPRNYERKVSMRGHFSTSRRFRKVSRY